MEKIGTEGLLPETPVDNNDEGQNDPETESSKQSKDKAEGSVVEETPEKEAKKAGEKTIKKTGEEKVKKTSERKAKESTKKTSEMKAEKKPPIQAKKGSAANATRTTTPPKGALRVGTEFTYPGGSRCAWLKKGQQGVIKRYYVNPSGQSFRYGVDFEVNGKTKSTQLATKYVEKPKK